MYSHYTQIAYGKQVTHGRRTMPKVQEPSAEDGVRSKVWKAKAAKWTELSKANASSLHSGSREFPIAADRVRALIWR
jgi:hypothetical protein